MIPILVAKKVEIAEKISEIADDRRANDAHPLAPDPLPFCAERGRLSRSCKPVHRERNPFYSVMRSFRHPQAGSPIALVPGACSPLASCGGVYLAL